MKKLFTMAVAAIVSITAVKAQSYKTGVGLALDAGDGVTLVGPTLKHFFNPNGAVEVDLAFGNHVTELAAYYQYHGAIANAGGLKWYVGGGPALFFGGGTTVTALRPMVGLDFRVPKSPIALYLDWRPGLYLYSGNSEFVGGKFGLGARFVLR